MVFPQSKQRPDFKPSPRPQGPQIPPKISRKSQDEVVDEIQEISSQPPPNNCESSPNGRDIDRNTSSVTQFEADFANHRIKIQRFPPSLWPLYKRYGYPVLITIGPYNTDFDEEVMVVKNVAMHNFMSGTSFRSFDDMYAAFSSAIGDVRHFYNRSDVDQMRMREYDMLKYEMLRDGCFLMQYMKWCTTVSHKMPPSLVCYFDSNQAIINRDIMLLENQLPWVVIQTLRTFNEVPVQEFVSKMMRTFQVREGNLDEDNSIHDYDETHLLGLLRLYKSFSLNIFYNCSRSGSPTSDGTSNSEEETSDGTRRPMSKTTSAIELAEIGVKLTASKTTKFTDVGIKRRLFCTEFFLAPLLLDETRLCWLVNMAAFEVCMGTTLRNEVEKRAERAVCSYLVVLAMLMDREEDVHKLRSIGLVQGELTNKETLDFFKYIVKHISGGPLYFHIMEEIEDYKIRRWMWIKLHKFLYKNYKTITAVLSVTGFLIGIFKALLVLKQH